MLSMSKIQKYIVLFMIVAGILVYNLKISD